MENNAESARRLIGELWAAEAAPVGVQPIGSSVGRP
jgi:hypothetical protein